jgi:hypothetical protein
VCARARARVCVCVRVRVCVCVGGVDVGERTLTHNDTCFHIRTSLLAVHMLHLASAQNTVVVDARQLVSVLVEFKPQPLLPIEQVRVVPRWLLAQGKHHNLPRHLPQRFTFFD